MSGNTVMTAKNSFSEGLIMDFSPENTQANCMTSALNATLLTFNGNEMSLQNDMGNGRVETAYLPDGYVPVGTCEFGDIVYIVSYNPLIDKALVGCFPSPERNISSEELHNQVDTLSWEDFQEKSGNEPNGNLKTSSVKKILFENKLYPGDKYIISSENISSNHISAYGSTNYDLNDFPKLVKIHVVSIDESGKMNYLDSSVKWYKDVSYFISNKKVSTSSGDKKIDIDEYRNLLSSGYSVFKSKTSGLLALLVELEKINGFSCSWDCFKNDSSTDTNNVYDIYLNFNWTSENADINPKGCKITGQYLNKSYLTWVYNQDVFRRDQRLLVSNPTLDGLTDGYILFSRHYEQETNMTYTDYQNICYNKSIKNLLSEHLNDTYNKITIVQLLNGAPKLTDKGLKTYVFNYNNISMNNNGLFLYTGGTLIEEDKVYDSLINNYFKYPVVKKLGTFQIPTYTKLTVNNQSILKENDISNLIYKYEVIPAMPYGLLSEFKVEGFIDFSKIGKKHIDLHTWKYYVYENTVTLMWGMDSYTEINHVITDVVFEFYDETGLVAIMKHNNYRSFNGLFTEYIILNTEGGNGNLLTLNNDLYELKGILNSNKVYLVKIITKQGIKMNDGNIVVKDESDVVFYRWFWTNGVFNSNFYIDLDYNDLQLNLSFDCDVEFQQKADAWECKKSTISANYKEMIVDNEIDTLSAKVQTVEPNKDNVQGTVKVKLSNTFNTFSILDDSKVNVTLIEGAETLKNNIDKPQVNFSKETLPTVRDFIYPITNLTPGVTTDLVLWNDLLYKNFVNTANILLSGKTTDYTSKDNELYLNSQNRLELLQGKKCIKKTNVALENTFNMQFSTTHYSKYYHYNTTTTGSRIILKSFLYNIEDLSTYNLFYTNGLMYFQNYAFGAYVNVDDEGKDVHRKVWGYFKRTNSGNDTDSREVNWCSCGGKTYFEKSKHTYTAKEMCPSLEYMFTPFVIGYDENYLKDRNGDINPGKSYGGNQILVIAMCNANNNLVVKTYSTKYDGNAEDDANNNLAKSRKYDDNKKTIVFIKSSSGTISSTDLTTETECIKRIVSLLYGLYYRTDSDEEIKFKKRDNYVYLEDNCMLYNRDIVLKIDPYNVKISVNNKELSVIKDNIVKNVGVGDVNLNNVTLSISSCIKAFPIQFEVYYLQPDLTYSDEAEAGVLIMGFNNNNKVIKSSANIEANQVYLLEGDSIVPVTLRESMPLYSFSNINFNEKTCTVSGSSKMSIKEINKQISVSNNKLKVINLADPAVCNTIERYMVSGEGDGDGYVQFKQTGYLA